MFTFENEANLAEDREDLIAVLQMRFGKISGEMIVKIYEIDDMHTLQRLIIAAANASSWSVFLQEFESGVGSYRLLGEGFNPIAEWKGRVDLGEEEK